MRFLVEGLLAGLLNTSHLACFGAMEAQNVLAILAFKGAHHNQFANRADQARIDLAL